MIFSSPHPAVTIPEIPLTDFVLQRASEFGDKPAIIEGSPAGQSPTLNLFRRFAASHRVLPLTV